MPVVLYCINRSKCESYDVEKMGSPMKMFEHRLCGRKTTG